MIFKKLKRKLTPSGLGDNGIWLFALEDVSFPIEVLKRAIIEERTYKIGEGTDFRKELAITVDGVTWHVQGDLKKILAEVEKSR